MIIKRIETGTYSVEAEDGNSSRTVAVINNVNEGWQVTLADSGAHTVYSTFDEAKAGAQEMLSAVLV